MDQFSLMLAFAAIVQATVSFVVGLASGSAHSHQIQLGEIEKEILSEAAQFQKNTVSGPHTGEGFSGPARKTVRLVIVKAMSTDSSLLTDYLTPVSIILLVVLSIFVVAIFLGLSVSTMNANVAQTITTTLSLLNLALLGLLLRKIPLMLRIMVLSPLTRG